MESEPVLEAPHFNYVVKPGDWAEYLVEEASSATVLCSSEINSNEYLPLAVGDRVRLIVSDISEVSRHSYVYPNDTVALTMDDLVMGVSLNGRSILNDTFMSLIPFGIGGSAYSDAYSTGPKPAFHPVTEDGYWTIFGRHQAYVCEEMLHVSFAIDIGVTQVEMVYNGAYRITASLNVGAPLKMSNSNAGGRWRVSIVDTNIVGLIGGVRPRYVTIIPPTGTSGVTSSSIMVWWTQSQDVNFTRYEVYASGARSSYGVGVSVANITDRSVTSFNASGLVPSAFHYFTVRVYNQNCYADSDAVGVRTLSVSASTPIRIAKIDLANPQWVNSSRPLLIDASSEGGFNLELSAVTGPCNLTVNNITSPATGMRPEPWAMGSDGRFKVTGNILEINTTGAVDFTGRLEICLSLERMQQTGITKEETYSMQEYAWDNGSQRWGYIYGGSSGTMLAGDDIRVHTDIAQSGYYATIYWLAATPITLIMPNPSDVTDTSVKLSWTSNKDPDFACYEVYQSSTPGEVGEQLARIQYNATTTYNVTGLTKGNTYYFTVRVRTMTGLYHEYLYSDSGTMTMKAGSPDSITIIPEFGAIPLMLALALTTLLVTVLTILPRSRRSFPGACHYVRCLGR
jgi:hypothetical protein